MAASVVAAGIVSTPGAAVAASASPAAVSETRTLGCGTAVVHLTWATEDPVRLMVADSNVAGAARHAATPLEAGEHSFASDAHTLSWTFMNAALAPVEVEAKATCERHF